MVKRNTIYKLFSAYPGLLDLDVLDLVGGVEFGDGEGGRERLCRGGTLGLHCCGVRMW